MKNRLTIATRASRLAIQQSEITRELLQAKFPNLIIEFLEVTTHGDIDQSTPLSSFGGTGVFVKRLEQKLLSGEADIAVHSLKDVPTTSHPALILAAFPQREDVRDVLITENGGTLDELKAGSIIGTSSPARQEQLKLLRPDLVFKNIRGNIDTRVEKVKNGVYNATVLAAAGLKRLKFELNENCFFTLDELVPSPGQGALVAQVHKDNSEILEMVRQINIKTIEKQVKAERRFMEIIGGGCRYPVAAHAEIVGEKKVVFRAIAHKPNWNKLEKIKAEIKIEELYKMVEQIATETLVKNNRI